MLMRLITGHEIAHWFESVFTDHEWTRREQETREHLRTWLQARTDATEEYLRLVQETLGDPVRLDRWTREIQADLGAYSSACSSATLGGWLQGKDALRPIMQVNTSLSMYFWMLRLFEVYYQARGVQLGHESHPPANLRAAVFRHAEARRFKRPYDQYLLQLFGTGAAAAYLLEKVLDEYLHSPRKRRRWWRR